MRFVSRKEAAAELGVTRQYIEKLIKRGTIKEVDRQIDIDAAREARDRNTDPNRRMAKQLQQPAAPLPSRQGQPRQAEPLGDGVDPDLLTFDQARTQRERANASLAELKYAEQSKRLIPREQVQAKEFAIARKMRDRILGFPVKLQQFIPPEAIKMLTDECESLVRELQEDAAKVAE